MNDTPEASHHDFATLDVCWERGDAAPGRPVAVEVTFVPATPRLTPGERPPLSIGLAIDRSGSMAGGKLEAARRAAAGVLESLRDGERFAAAAFDDEVVDVTPSVALDDRARLEIRGRLAGIETRGMTALFDGFARAAELVARGGAPAGHDSWVLVLSDGMGNRGITEPAALREHAAALADRGIRTITVGIGADYLADQLTALADGGAGEFHHASIPDEIVEIVLGELRGLRSVAARDLRLAVSCAGAGRRLLLGGDVSRAAGETRFDRVATGRGVRVVLLVWPSGDALRAEADASWENPDASRGTARCAASCPTGGQRDVALALRAARLWHAGIVARALELNERESYAEAARWVQRAQAELAGYMEGLPLDEVRALVDSLDEIALRAGRRWRTLGHREAYTLSTKILRGKSDLRASAPRTVRDAIARDD